MPTGKTNGGGGKKVEKCKQVAAAEDRNMTKEDARENTSG